MGNRVEGEAFFADGSPCLSCEIRVLDLNGKEILKRKTDEKGKFSFSIPSGVSEIKILLSAGEGHLVEKRLTLKTNYQKKGDLLNSQTLKGPFLTKPISRDEKEVYKNLEEKISKLEDEVKALREEVLNMRKEIQKIYYRDIIGAIGYILGIFAIIYFIKKKTNPKKDAS
ncbi:MAG: emp24/gp25L/p24 family protein [Caldimicrobium sp.]